MTGEPVLAELNGAVGLARLNRPDARNALAPDLMEALAQVVEEWDLDPDVSCIVIAGSDEYFAAGADVGTMADPALEDSLALASARFWPRMASCRTPLVAGVSGYALGSGFELALLCDVVVAAPTAEFGLPEVLLGVLPSGGATQRIARVIGRQRAMELIVTGRRIDAEEALRLGLVNQIAPRKKWLEQALDLANVVARRPPVAVRLVKEAVLAAEEMGLDAGLAEERRLHGLSMATEDRVEGMRAFLEQRRPRFKGR